MPVGRGLCAPVCVVNATGRHGATNPQDSRIVKRYAKDGKDIEEVICVNPVSVKVKYAQGQLVEARQYPDDGGGEGLDLPVDQVLHLKWDAPAFSPRGNSLVLPAFQSIELLRDYRRAEQAIAKRWGTPFRLLKVGGAFGQKMVMPDQKMLEAAGPQPGLVLAA